MAHGILDMQAPSLCQPTSPNHPHLRSPSTEPPSGMGETLPPPIYLYSALGNTVLRGAFVGLTSALL